jgi:hypothetical protein
MTATVIIGCSSDAANCRSLFMDAGVDAVWGQPLPPSERILADIAEGRIRRLGQMAAQLPGCKRLLLVDDSAVTVKHFIRRLKLTLPASWTIQSRPDLDKVITRLLNKTIYYDVIITGEYFRGSDKIKGSDFITRVRDGGYEGIIIGCSADPRFVEKHLECGADLAWTKPPPSNELIVSQLLRLLPRLNAPEPIQMYNKQIITQVEVVDAAVVAAVTAFNHSLDSQVKPKLTKKNISKPGRKGHISIEEEMRESGMVLKDLSHNSLPIVIITPENSVHNPLSTKCPGFKRVQFVLENTSIHCYSERDPPSKTVPPTGDLDDPADAAMEIPMGSVKKSATGKEMFVARRLGGGRRNTATREDSDDEEDDY